MEAETVSYEQLASYINRLLDAAGLTPEEFAALGAAGQLAEINSDLDFAYKAIWPLVKDRMVAA